VGQTGRNVETRAKPNSAKNRRLDGQSRSERREPKIDLDAHEKASRDGSNGCRWLRLHSRGVMDFDDAWFYNADDETG
jgi:hypothetical protein